MSSTTLEIILDILFVVILATGFLVGMWRGVRKSSLNFGITLAGVLLAFFVTRPITDAILSIKTSLNGKPCTLGNYFYELILQNGPASPFVTSNPNLGTAVQKVPFAILSCVVFMLLSIIVSLLAYAIYRIIASLVLNKHKEKDSKIKGNRLWGGGIGLAKTFLIAIFAVMPVSAIIDVTSKIFEPSTVYITDDAYEPRSALQGILPDQVGQIFKGLDRSAFCAVGTMFGLNNPTCDYLSSFQLEGSAVSIRYELNNYADVYSAGNELAYIFQGETSFPLSNFDFKKLDSSVEKSIDGPLFKYALSKMVGNIIKDYRYYTYIDFGVLGEYKPIIEKLSSAFQYRNNDFSKYFSDDIRKVLSAFENAAKTKALDGIKANSVTDVLKTLATEHRDVLEPAVRQILTTNILHDSAEALVDIGLKKMLNEKISSKVSWTGLSDEDMDSLASSVVEILAIYADLPSEDILSILENPLILTSKDKNFDSTLLINCGKMIDLLRSVDIIKDNRNQQIVDSLLQKYDMDVLSDVQTVYGIDGNELQIENYQQLMEFLSQSLKTINEFEFYDTLKDPDVTSAKVLKKFSTILEKDPRALEKMILPLQQLDFTNERLIQQMLNGLDTKFVDFNALQDYKDWKDDLGHISNILLALSAISNGEETLLDSLLNKTTEEFLKALSGSDCQGIFEPIFNAKSTVSLKNNLLGAVKTFTTQLTGKQVQIEYNNDLTQSKQISDVFDKFLPLYSSYEDGNQISSFDKKALGELLNAMKINTYSGDTEGVFGQAFVAFVEKIKTEYPALELGDDYRDVDFVEVLTSLDG